MDLKDKLKPEFISASLNLASKSLTDWGKWSEEKDFPAQGTWQEKLHHVDKVLEAALAPMKHRPNERMFWRTRPDLNKYRGWLLNRVLQHQLAIQKNIPGDRFALPEDLPKLVDDLYLFHKHNKTIGRKHGKDAGTLQYYKTLAELNNAIQPYEALYPLTNSDRSKAHARFMRDHGGNGEALQVAVLPDGTEVIQVLSENASRAYGSPRWCTAYRSERTYFEDYKDDLLIIVDPDGQRWQFHFRSNQLHDENDRRIEDVVGFLNDRENLATVLTPYWEKALKQKIEGEIRRGSNGRAIALLDLALPVAQFKKIAMQKDGFLDKAVSGMGLTSENNRSSLFISIINSLKEEPGFQAIFEPHVFDKGVAAYSEGLDQCETYNFPLRNFTDFWNTVLSVPTWKTRAIKEGQFDKALRSLLRSAEDDVFEIFTSLAAKYSQDSEVKKVLTSLVCVDAFERFHQNPAASMTYGYVRLCKLVMADPEWKAIAIERGVHEKSLSLLEKGFAAYDAETGDRNGKYEPIPHDYIGFCVLIKRVPEWAAYAAEQGYFARAISKGYLDQKFDKYEGHAKENNFYGRTSRDYIKYFWQDVLTVPEWRKHAKAENRLGRMLDILFDKNAQQGAGLGLHLRRESNNPAKTLIFMMRSFFNEPEFRGHITPHITAALALSKGQDARIQIPLSRRVLCRNITTEILKFAAQCEEWRATVTEDHIETALRDDNALPHVLTWAKRRGVMDDWKRAVTSSKAITEFLESDKSILSPVKTIIAGHEPYKKAFGISS